MYNPHNYDDPHMAICETCGYRSRRESDAIVARRKALQHAGRKRGHHVTVFSLTDFVTVSRVMTPETPDEPPF